MAERNTAISDQMLEELLRRDRTDRLLRRNERWRERVPEHVDRAAEHAFQRMQTWIDAGRAPAESLSGPAGAGTAGAAAAGLGAWKLTALILTAAVLLAVGACTVSPALRESVGALFDPTQAGQTAERSAGKAPGDYVIPSPGEGFELRSEAVSDTLAVKWFAAERRLLMVQIAEQLPEEPAAEHLVDGVEIGGLPGAVFELDGDQELLLRDGNVLILIRYWNADREDLLDYAETLVAANNSRTTK